MYNTNRLLQLLALAMELPANFFAPRFDHPVSNIRAVHYSADPSDPEAGIFGVGEHLSSFQGRGIGGGGGGGGTIETISSGERPDHFSLWAVVFRPRTRASFAGDSGFRNGLAGFAEVARVWSFFIQEKCCLGCACVCGEHGGEGGRWDGGVWGGGVELP